MENITVEKDRLLSTIKENRNAHREQFLAAQEKYRERVIGELDKRLVAARNGGRIDLGFRLPEPVDYTDDYDTAIQMIEWSLGDTVELSHDDFARYVLNDWEWKRMFAANTQSYLG